MKNHQNDLEQEESGSRQRSRSRQKKKIRQKNQNMYFIKPDLSLTKHYYHIHQQKLIGVPFAIQNIFIKHAKKPCLTLVLCKNVNEIENAFKFLKVQRRIVYLYDEEKIDLSKKILQEKAEAIVMSTYKSSILCAIEDIPKIFSLIINLNFIPDPEYYQKINSFLYQTGGSIISFVGNEKDTYKIEKGSKIKFTEINIEVNENEIEKQVLSSIQFAEKPKKQTISLVKMLPFCPQEISARLFEQNCRQLNFCKSKHLELPGYISYQITTDVQFNSIKYIWNFLKEYLNDDIMKQIKGMTKVANGKGAVFDAPQETIHEFRQLIRRHNHTRKKDKRYDINFVSVLPELEDIRSVDYKQKEQKKEYALKHKSELQIFIGGLPYISQQRQIRQYFKSKRINLFTIRIMKDSHGVSRGTCFALCEDRNSLERALKLDGPKFDDKIIRISLADKRDKK